MKTAINSETKISTRLFCFCVVNQFNEEKYREKFCNETFEVVRILSNKQNFVNSLLAQDLN